MSELRPECKDAAKGSALPYDTALYLIRESVARRRSLAYGKLHKDGLSCAIGSFWDDNPKVALSSRLIDEVAAVNDSLPPTSTPHERWKKVNSWLRWKVAVLAGKNAAKP